MIDPANHRDLIEAAPVCVREYVRVVREDLWGTGECCGNSHSCALIQHSTVSTSGSSCQSNQSESEIITFKSWTECFWLSRIQMLNCSTPSSRPPFKHDNQAVRNLWWFSFHAYYSILVLALPTVVLFALLTFCQGQYDTVDLYSSRMTSEGIKWDHCVYHASCSLAQVPVQSPNSRPDTAGCGVMCVFPK